VVLHLGGWAWGLQLLTVKNKLVTKIQKKPRTWTDALDNGPKKMRWAGHVARMGETSNAYRILVAKPEGKRPLGRPRRRWVDNIKIDIKEIGWDGVDWIDLAQDRDQWRALVNTVMKLRVP
jgi:hypothetical protein